MANEVIFDEPGAADFQNENMVRNIAIVPGAPTGIIKWLITKKIVKNGHQAEKVLLSVVITFVVFAIGLQILINTHPNASPAQQAAMLQEMENEAQFIHDSSKK